MAKKRFFREHRGGYSESMKTMREVKSVKDIQDYLNSVYPEGYLKNIRVAYDTVRHHRTSGDEWGDETYMVVADFEGHTSQCVGYANFYSEDEESETKPFVVVIRDGSGPSARLVNVYVVRAHHKDEAGQFVLNYEAVNNPDFGKMKDRRLTVFANIDTAPRREKWSQIALDARHDSWGLEARIEVKEMAESKYHQMGLIMDGKELHLDQDAEIEITDVNPLTGNNEPFYICDLQDDEDDNDK